MDKNNIRKEYSNGELTVVWQSGKCIHSGNCVRNLPQVFNPTETPWIKVTNATSDEITETVNKWPFGALSFFINKSMFKFSCLSESEQI